MNRREALFTIGLGALALPKIARASSMDYLNAYQATYPDMNQGGTGACMGCTVAAAMQACALNVQGQAIPPLSWAFLQYSNTGDSTFRSGSTIPFTTSQAGLTGVCADSLYPSANIAAAFNGFPLPIPNQAAYTDALQRKILRVDPLTVSGAAVDLGVAAATLRAGYPIALGMAGHAVCLLAVSDDGWWFYGKSSYQPGQVYLTNGGQMLSDGHDAQVVKQVMGAPAPILPPPPGCTP